MFQWSIRTEAAGAGMAIHQGPHLRKSTRLPAYDYATPGNCFVTIVVMDRHHRLGSIGPDTTFRPSAVGHMVINAWLAAAELSTNLISDEFIVMPDHLHGIVTLGVDPTLGPPTSLSAFVHRFKPWSTHEYAKGAREQEWPPCAGRLWQINYYERIIRHDGELDKFRAYIRDNPRRWIERQVRDQAE